MVKGGRKGGDENDKLREKEIVMKIINNKRIIEEDLEKIEEIDIGNDELKKMNIEMMDVMEEGSVEEGIEMRREMVDEGNGDMIKMMEKVVKGEKMWKEKKIEDEDDESEEMSKEIKLNKRESKINKEMRDVEEEIEKDEKGELLESIRDIKKKILKEDEKEEMIDGFGM